MAKSNSTKVSWAIRSYSRMTPNGGFEPFMEVYFPTREKMRKHWNEMIPSFKSGGFFKAVRLRVTDYELIGKRSYAAVR